MSGLKDKLGVVAVSTGGTGSVVGAVGAGCATACVGGCEMHSTYDFKPS